MGSDGVVKDPKLVENVLELLRGSGRVLGEVFLEGLPESFDFALCGGFVGAAVLLGDAFEFEECLERVQAGLASALGEPGGVDHAVIGERGSREPVCLCGGGEGVRDGGAGDSWVGAEVEEVSGVVVEPADDFDFFSGGAAPVGEV